MVIYHPNPIEHNCGPYSNAHIEPELPVLGCAMVNVPTAIFPSFFPYDLLIADTSKNAHAFAHTYLLFMELVAVGSLGSAGLGLVYRRNAIPSCQTLHPNLRIPE